jgi:hypothetical protein
MLMILAEVYSLMCILLLSGKDSSSYLLKDHNRVYTLLDKSRIQRWHRDGVALNALVISPIVYLRPDLYLIILYTVLIRLSVFDVAFNRWSSLDYRFLGSTALVDKIFSKIFGKYGAVRKSIFFGIILIILNILLWK